MTGIFDSHAHYDDPAFDADRDALLQSLPQKGVGTVLNCGADLATSRQSVRLAENFDFVYAAVGIHPEAAASYDESARQQLRELAVRKKVVAIGEIGLDYHYENTDKAAQHKAFTGQMALAEELGLPIIIHSRDAIADTLDCLGQYRGKGVFHCYSESAEIARRLIAADFYFGFGGVLTFKNARRAVESAALVPTDRLLIETDCPYMAPTPLRGQRNDSSLLHYVVAKLAEIRQLSPEEITAITRKNAERLFGISQIGDR